MSGRRADESVLPRSIQKHLFRGVMAKEGHVTDTRRFRNFLNGDVLQAAVFPDGIERAAKRIATSNGARVLISEQLRLMDLAELTCFSRRHDVANRMT